MTSSLKVNIILQKLQLKKLYSPIRNLTPGNKLPALVLKKPLCTGDLPPTCKIFIERPTKRRYRIWKDAINLAKEHPDLDYVFADVNCCFKVFLKDGTSNFFNDIDNLKSTINIQL